MKKLLLALLLLMAAAGDARADDGGTDADVDAGDGIPLGCDGALCDTSNGATCDVSAVGHGASSAWIIAAAMGAFMIARRRRALAGALTVAASLAPNVASAEPPGPVDVAIHDAPPPRRYVVVAWNPVPAFTIGKASFDVVITPISHHALVLAPFYATTTTEPIVVQDASGSPIERLPKQTFQGFGGEIGYRYYSGDRGPRGFFAGPSFLIGIFDAIAQDQSKTSYMYFGGALDVGFSTLVADRVAISFGAGAQYTATDKAIPNQQFPANIYANNGLRPRLLFALGVAF